MSIPVYEHCGHLVRRVAPSKAKHWVQVQSASERVPGVLAQGVQLPYCQYYVEIPYAALQDILARTQAPTRRLIHPWIDQAVIARAMRAGLVQSAAEDHHVRFTDRGLAVLQSTYAKLLRQDLDRGLELVAVLAGALRGAVRDTRPDLGSLPWTAAAHAALQRVDSRWPGAAAYFRAMPEVLVRRLIHFEPYTVDRMLNER